MPSVRSVQWLLFDLGGVLVRFHIDQLERLVERPVDRATLLEGWAGSALFGDFERGRIDADRFVAEFCREAGLEVAPDEFRAVFCNWVSGYLDGATDLLDSLGTRFRLACLSNCNSLHWERLRELGVLDRFEVALSSHHIGHRKPAAEAFRHALDALDTPADRVLFIDDVRQNTDAAAAAGMHALRTRGAAETHRALAELGLVPHPGACRDD